MSSSEEILQVPEPVSAVQSSSSQQQQREGPSSRITAAAAPAVVAPVPPTSSAASTTGVSSPFSPGDGAQRPPPPPAAAAAPVPQYSPPPPPPGAAGHPPVAAPPPSPPQPVVYDNNNNNYSYSGAAAPRGRTAPAAAAPNTNTNYYPPAPYSSYYHPHPQQQQPQQSQSQQQDATTPLLAAAVTAGGVLGLTAAAAVRWLNGGDFALFPPATMMDNGQRRIDGMEAEEAAAAAAATTTVADDSRQQQALVTASSLQSLQETVAAQSEQQAVLIRRLREVLEADHRQSTTDESMMHLRSLKQQQPVDSSLRLQQESLLRDIHSELAALRCRQERTVDDGDGDNEDDDTNDRLDSTLDKLNDVLEQISSSLSNNKAAATTTSSDANEIENGGAATNEKTPSKVSFSVETPCSKQPQPPPTTPPDDDLADAILGLLDGRHNDATAVRAGAQLLYLYCVNVCSHPRVPRYRKIYTTNESFRGSVASLHGAPALLRAVGFVPVTGCGGGGGGGSSNLNTNSGSNNVPTVPAEATAYWEWLPPSIRNKKTNDGADTDNNNNNIIEPSPKQAWLGDSEEFYLHRLKVAAAALSLIKSPTFNSSASGKRELFELLGLDPDGDSSAARQRNAAQSFSVDELSVTTPDRSGISFSDDGNDNSSNPVNCTPTIHGPRGGGGHPASCFETPDTGSVLSPPATKKQSSLSSDFPSLEPPPLGVEGGEPPPPPQHRSLLSPPPSLNVLDEGDSYEQTSEDNSFVGATAGDGNHLQQSENAMWK